MHGYCSCIHDCRPGTTISRDLVLSLGAQLCAAASLLYIHSALSHNRPMMCTGPGRTILYFHKTISWRNLIMPNAL